jgi:hypothetical protein
MSVDILNTRRLPARLNADQAAALIGVPASGIALLIASKLLRPLGAPVQNSMKVFASVDLEERCRDPKWLDRVTRCIEEHHREKNKAAAQRNGPSSTNENAAAA